MKKSTSNRTIATTAAMMAYVDELLFALLAAAANKKNIYINQRAYMKPAPNASQSLLTLDAGHGANPFGPDKWVSSTCERARSSHGFFNRSSAWHGADCPNTSVVRAAKFRVGKRRQHLGTTVATCRTKNS
jgi:hypothetical protein